MKQIIGRKLGMTRVFATDGTQYVATIIEVLPNIIKQKKELDKDKYVAYVVGYGVKKDKNANNCEKGVAKKSNLPIFLFSREISGDEIDKLNLTIGSKVDVSLFKAGDVVDVIGISKGKGYSGVIKKYHHIIGPKSHGSGYHRGLGSFANNGRCNNRVLPGKKMSGHYGFSRSTIANLLVLEVNVEKKYMLIKGSIPGSKKSIVKIRSAIRKQFSEQKIKPFFIDNASDKKNSEKVN